MRGVPPKIQVKALSESEQNRLEEVKFFYIIQQFTAAKLANAAPMGTTIPHMLGSLIRGVNPGVIEYAFNTISMPSNTPSGDEVVAMFRYTNVSANRAPMNERTYYKWLKRWLNKGMMFREPALAELQHIQIKRFNKGYQDTFMGRNKILSAMEL